MKPLVLLCLLCAGVAAGCGSTEAEEKTAVAPAPQAKVELPPLPSDAKPKVVQPEAGVLSEEEDLLADPATGVAVEEDAPTPKAPASNTSARGRKDPGTGSSLTKATALENGVALPPLEAPPEVHQIIEAGNQIAKTPYKWGGGHGNFQDDGYDCSGSVTFALYSAGLIGGSATSGQLVNWGKPGKGKWVTIWTHDGHVFMEVAGIRFDTSGTRKTGSRWQNDMRSTKGFVARHPPGL